jgi:HAD superfamily hydrolase (TIGR01484 family)
MNRILLCTDLDRTLLPNGSQPESPSARERFRQVAARPELTLAYVTGRHLQLIREAIETYELPVPDYAVGDVGTTIYQARPDGEWQAVEAWQREIAADWGSLQHDDLAGLLDDIGQLRQQESNKQNAFKLSYYAPADTDAGGLQEEVTRRLGAADVRAAVIWSVDESRAIGLLDVLPERATKLHAIRFLMHELGCEERQTVFAGDSGNDLPVLTSGLQAVLVRNAADEVRDAVTQAMRRDGLDGRVYLARGDFLGLNGHYAGGILEGLAHFRPETEAWMRPSAERSG